MIGALARRILARAALLAFSRINREFREALIEANSHAATAAIVRRNICHFLRRAFFITSSSVQHDRVRRALRAIIAISRTAMRVIRVQHYRAATVRQGRQARVQQRGQRGNRGRPLQLITKLCRHFRRLSALNRLLALNFKINFIRLFARHFAFLLRVRTLRRNLGDFNTRLNIRFIARLFRHIRVLLFDRSLLTLRIDRATFSGRVKFRMRRTFSVTRQRVRRRTSAKQRQFRRPSVHNQENRLSITRALATRFDLNRFGTTLLASRATIFRTLMLATRTLMIFCQPGSANTRGTIALEFRHAMISNFQLFGFAREP